MKQVFITGGTGYIGRRLVALLLERGYAIKALVREGSEDKLPKGCSYVFGNPLSSSTFSNYIPADATFVQLLGVAHPGPKKKEQFRLIDLASARASADAAKRAGVRHFVYVSVAQTRVNMMKDSSNAVQKAKLLSALRQYPRHL